MSTLEELQSVIDKSKRIVFFGGAGVSTESGIPDFRSVDGLYNQKYDYPPEQILSHTFFVHKTSEFFRFYRDKMLCLDKKPNKAHYKLAELEKAGKLSAVVTQNIDGLHQAAGSKRVYELHGSVLRNYCTKCGRFYDAEFIKNSADIPKCTCTSLTVYPAAGFIRYFGGDNLVLINRDPTPMDKNANLVFHEKVGELLDKITVNI